MGIFIAIKGVTICLYNHYRTSIRAIYYLSGI